MKLLHGICLVFLTVFSTPLFALPQYAYVTNLSNNSVTVLDVSKDPVSEDQFVANLYTSNFNFKAPIDVAITPDGAYVYVVNRDGYSVTVIKTSNNSFVTNISPVFTPASIAIASNGYAYVTNNSNNSVTVINTSNNSIVTTLSGGSFNFNHPIGVAITPGGYAYVTNQSNSTVTVINTSDNSFVANLAGHFAAPYAVAIAPDGRYAYVTNTGNKSVTVIDTSNNSFVTSINTHFYDFYDITIASNGYAYMPSYNNGSVGIIDTSNNSYVKTLSTGFMFGGPQCVAVTPDGSYLYVGNGNSSVTVVDIAISETIHQVNLLTGGKFKFGNCSSIAITPAITP